MKVHSEPGRRRLSRAWWTWLVAVSLAVTVAAGCERRSDATRTPAAGEASARLRASADFGAVPLADTAVTPGGSVLDAMRGLTDVRTAYGGAYVSRMYGRSSDLRRRRDWFFYVDGVLADRSAAEVSLRDGTEVWWDHRYWGAQMDAWAVVGAWPAPWAGGGAERPVAADPPLDAPLRAAGAHLVTGDAPWRVRVGSDAELRRREPAWARAAADPGRAGLTAAIENGAVTALDATGDVRVPVPGARALVAAVPAGDVPSRGTVLVAVGLDGAAARAAAATVVARPDVLALRYAVVFDGDGQPLRAAGRATP